MPFHYRVIWEVDVWADSPRDAAAQAREMQLKPESVATCFDVVPLLDGEPDPGRSAERLTSMGRGEGWTSVDLDEDDDDEPLS